MFLAPTIDDFIALVRNDLTLSATSARASVNQVEREHNAAGRLESGATIIRIFESVHSEFGSGVDTALQHLAAAIHRGDPFDPSELRQHTMQLLANYVIDMKDATGADKLKSFGPVEAINDKLAAFDSTMAFKIRQFDIGFSLNDNSEDRGSPVSIFNRLAKTDCELVASDGKVRATTKGHFAQAKIILFDPKVVVQVGDEIRRRLPNGTDDTFRVVDFIFAEGLGGIPSHFQVTVVRKGNYPHGQGGNYINVTGSNSRVNIGSQDHSSNIVVEGDVFGSLSTKLRSELADHKDLPALLSAVEEMKTTQESSGFLAAYQKFVSLTADHLGIIGPFLPALAQYLPS